MSKESQMRESWVYRAYRHVVTTEKPLIVRIRQILNAH